MRKKFWKPGEVNFLDGFSYKGVKESSENVILIQKPKAINVHPMISPTSTLNDLIVMVSRIE
jgi:hypothetical protein